MRSDLQFLVGVGIKIGRVRVEITQHAANGVRNQFLVIDFFDIALLDGIEYFGKDAQIFDRQTIAHIFFFRQRRQLQANQDAAQHSCTDQTGVFQFTHQFCSRTKSLQADPPQRVNRFSLMTYFEV